MSTEPLLEKGPTQEPLLNEASKKIETELELELAKALKKVEDMKKSFAWMIRYMDDAGHWKTFSAWLQTKLENAERREDVLDKELTRITEEYKRYREKHGPKVDVKLQVTRTVDGGKPEVSNHTLAIPAETVKVWSPPEDWEPPQKTDGTAAMQTTVVKKKNGRWDKTVKRSKFTPVKESKLPNPVQRVLQLRIGKETSLETLAMLWTEKDLLKIPGIGPAAIKSVRKEFKRLGYAFKDETDNPPFAQKKARKKTKKK